RSSDHLPDDNEPQMLIAILAATAFRIAASDTCPPHAQHATDQAERLDNPATRHDSHTAGHFGQCKTEDLIAVHFCRRELLSDANI
ncbi:hypothetical protein RI367_004290, partial [Sorochytrium milnesiophthora]